MCTLSVSLRPEQKACEPLPPPDSLLPAKTLCTLVSPTPLYSSFLISLSLSLPPSLPLAFCLLLPLGTRGQVKTERGETGEKGEGACLAVRCGEVEGKCPLLLGDEWKDRARRGGGGGGGGGDPSVFSRCIARILGSGIRAFPPSIHCIPLFLQAVFKVTRHQTNTYNSLTYLMLGSMINN